MSEKKMMTKDVVPEDFTMGLALMDALPVLFFGIGSLFMGRIAGSGIVLAGGFVCFATGMLKVAWKIIVVLQKKNIWPLFVQMRICMPIGFVLMIIGCFLGDAGKLGHALLNPASLVFLALFVVGMFLMIRFAMKLDASNVRDNWIEQWLNALAQGAFMVSMIAASHHI